jgi:primosomal protein N' (replication factor Y)
VSDVAGPIAQIVPDLPTFAVDDGFAYRVPEGIDLSVGSIVRVPLGARRVRGYVVSLRSGDIQKLKPIVSVSGDMPVFDDLLLRTLRWAAVHYVAPLSVLLGRAAPPNLPKGKTKPPQAEVPQLTSPLENVSRHAAEGRHLRPTYLITGGDYAPELAGVVSAPLRAGRNVAVIAPTVEESSALADRLAEEYGDRVITVSSALAARTATTRWMLSQREGGLLIVGTPEIALWPLGKPTLWVIVEEGRRAMKSKQTPTLQVRDVVRRRSLVERSAVAFVGPVPTLDVLVRGAAAVEPPGRVWPLVEIVDRREDPPVGRSLAARTLQAVQGTVRRGGQVFVFVSRRGYAPAFRCIKCRELRRCPKCGSGPDRGDTCRRCGAPLGPCAECGGRRFEPLGAGIGRVAEELARYVGEAHVGPVGSGRQVIVGSERDLPYAPECALAVAVDADSLLMAPNYRAEEDAVRLLARVVLTVARGGGRRCLVQTGQPEHRAFAVLRNGHPLEYLRQLGDERERDHLPPAAELLAVEVTGDAKASDSDLAVLQADGIQIHGPESGGGRTRWFVQGRSLEDVRVRLRPMVQRWRDSGSKVRVDADPLDL